MEFKTKNELVFRKLQKQQAAVKTTAAVLLCRFVFKTGVTSFFFRMDQCKINFTFSFGSKSSLLQIIRNI